MSPISTAGPRLQSETLGVNADWVVGSTIADRDVELAEIARQGIGVVRAEVNWDQVEPAAPADSSAPHVWRWEMYDAWALSAAKVGVRWAPLLGYSAHWASTDLFQSQFAAPRDDGAFAAFAQAFAARYGRNGELWRQHPEVRAMPVATYEIWNEENTAGFWAKPDPARYANLLAAAASVIQGVDAAAKIVFGGLAPAPFTNGSSIKDTDFVAGVFRARPDLRGRIAGLGYHPYADSASSVVAMVRHMRRGLSTLGLGDLPLVLNEIGWPTRGYGPFKDLSDSDRATALSRVVDELARSDCGVSQVLAYNWVSPEQDPSRQLDWFGLYHRDHTPTATGVAFTSLVKSLEHADWPAGDEAVEHLCG